MEMAAGAELPASLCHQETEEKNHELMIYSVLLAISPVQLNASAGYQTYFPL